MFFEGFTLDHVDVGQVQLRVRHGGAGAAVLLLHGHPRTHATWHKVAPLLAERYTVVCPDLRGYGQSSKPATDAEHAPYAKRAMARDFVTLMRGLGHDRFAVAGHDRGALAAFRTAMDHPEKATALVAMDGLPVVEHLERCDARFAAAWWHWFFFGQSDKPAERIINADPDAWYAATDEHMAPEAWADLQNALHDPQTVHGMLEDYRAGLGIDRRHDEADRAAGRRIQCPTLVLWSQKDDLEDLYGDPREIWRAWAPDLRGHPIDSGHHMAEEAPADLANAIGTFLDGLNL
ncbi:alpha/beta hydrolase [Actinomadura darangshiensis]|uniref:Alpha/beta hydrolase n=1 Tax=Actinomadura darangshiensis TaxID=705336 RepID=A0A4R5BNB1_9ACTN|nr:alpha/beta hydrolase [Actinomadura darangshiensis]TDD88331.1 alpha/beta hydrolase [Actinomadura darangshiensis]